MSDQRPSQVPNTPEQEITNSACKRVIPWTQPQGPGSNFEPDINFLDAYGLRVLGQLVDLRRQMPPENAPVTTFTGGKYLGKLEMFADRYPAVDDLDHTQLIGGSTDHWNNYISDRAAEPASTPASA